MIGGKRKGSGRKRRFNERTIIVAFRIPVSKSIEVKTIVNKKLKQYESRKNQ